MVKKQGDSLQQEEFPLPKYVQDTLSKHNISFSPTFGMGKVEGVLLDTLAFQSHRYPDVDMPYLLSQIAGWQTARAKLPTWAANEDIIYHPICLWNNAPVNRQQAISCSLRLVC